MSKQVIQWNAKLTPDLLYLYFTAGNIGHSTMAAALSSSQQHDNLWRVHDSCHFSRVSPRKRQSAEAFEIQKHFFLFPLFEQTDKHQLSTANWPVMKETIQCPALFGKQLKMSSIGWSRLKYILYWSRVHVTLDFLFLYYFSSPYKLYYTRAHVIMAVVFNWPNILKLWITSRFRNFRKYLVTVLQMSEN